MSQTIHAGEGGERGRVSVEAFDSHDWRAVSVVPGFSSAVCRACGCRYIDRAARLPCRGGQVYGPEPDLMRLTDEEIEAEVAARYRVLEMAQARYTAALLEQTRRVLAHDR